MRPVSLLASALLATTLTATLSGCSDGVGGFTLSGTLYTSGSLVTDYDINDLRGGTRSNSDPLDPQPIPNITTVQGFASAVPTFAEASGDGSFERFAETPDEDDFYAVSLQAGQRILLTIVDYQNNRSSDSSYRGDLDLALYDPANQSDAVQVSNRRSSTEEIVVSNDGDYLIRVYAYSGISKYVLQLFPPENESTLLVGAARPSRTLIPGEAIVRWKDPSATSNTSSEQHAAQNAGPLPSITLTDALAQAQTQAQQPAIALHGYQLTSRLGRTDRAERVSLARTLQAQSSKSEAATESPSAFERHTPQWAAASDTLNSIKALNERDDVEYAAPNYVHRALFTPNDSLYRFQSHYTDIRLPQAWDLTQGSADVVVAVIDSGVFMAHPDLAGKLVDGYDFISDSRTSRDGDGIDSDPDDPGDSTQSGASSWHGTHVSGTIAAATNNNEGVAGSGFRTRVMPLRVLGLNSEGSSYDVMQAVRYAARLPNDSGRLPSRRADVINLSLGSNFSSTAEQAIFSAARDAGSIIVAAAGNSGSSEAFYPASYEGVISVSASAPGGSRAYYSNFGNRVDVAAPGGDLRFDLNGDGQTDGILSTSVNDASGNRVGDYRLQEGTSMATPHVAGVLALMKGLYPELTPQDVDSLLASGTITDDLGPAGRDDEFGHGRINALKAVLQADNLAGGGTIPATPVLDSDPSTLQFGTQERLTLTLTNANQNAEPPQVSADADVDWLVIDASSTDENGLGTYAISVNRSGLIDGLYNGTLRFTPDTGNLLEVQVTMQKGELVTADAAAPQYVLLEDISTGEIATETRANSDGTYVLRGVRAGSYRIIAGSDIDVDLFICQNGETCGEYPDRISGAFIEVEESLSGVDFVVSLVTGINTDADSGDDSADDNSDSSDPLLPLQRTPTETRVERESSNHRQTLED